MRRAFHKVYLESDGTSHQLTIDGERVKGVKSVFVKYEVNEFPKVIVKGLDAAGTICDMDTGEVFIVIGTKNYQLMEVCPHDTEEA